MSGQSGTLGVTASTASRMTFGAGALYRNYGTVGQERIGATRGGSVLEVSRRDRDIPMDGLPGPAQGLVRSVRTSVTLDVTIVELSAETKRELLRGSTETTGTKSRTTAAAGPAAADFLENLALVAEPWDDPDGTRVHLLRNVLPGIGGWTLRTEDAGAASVRIRVRAHYRTDDLDEEPYQEGILAELLRDWDPAEDLSGQTLTERIYEKDAQLGSTSGTDVNDPTWVTSPPSLRFGEDDYVKQATTPWDVS